MSHPFALGDPRLDNLSPVHDLLAAMVQLLFSLSRDWVIDRVFTSSCVCSPVLMRDGQGALNDSRYFADKEIPAALKIKDLPGVFQPLDESNGLPPMYDVPRDTYDFARLSHLPAFTLSDPHAQPLNQVSCVVLSCFM
jgi:hypothetical protein